MNIFKLIKQYGTQKQCIALLENARWGDNPVCPYCSSNNVYRQKERQQQSRWGCSQCKKSFSVTVGTIFHHTHLELPYWFAILTLMLNAKKSLSSYQISRDIGIRQGTALKIQHKIRKAMSEDQGKLLQGIVEMDETYIGGKPRKSNIRKNNKSAKRGRGTDKLPIVGLVERGGNVVAKVIKGAKLNSTTLKNIVKSTIDTAKSHLITDDYRAYNSMAVVLPHSTINHSIAYSFNGIHTNNIEGFWSLLERAWYGQHHHYSKVKAHLYVAESCYKYNNRENKNSFSQMVKKLLERK
jgi:transposase-like protein